ncbi:ABC-type oligopeptide transport system substrate-binding subunit [Microbacterium sp. SORGH_AS428]|uniref:hypothetical protein n=1 Tax=Microbacterium sp. SORGH_AS_0428 TaxID=3041788 RepID=UPI002863470D|nr:hypothetical protein [Microbacterium sp. SORGH_AS_0428]MDR6198479.1 ABC-type oligopeptide transport system substrate-binding subunit [Microbacterium sp. SORGH_AS_0428]
MKKNRPLAVALVLAIAMLSAACTPATSNSGNVEPSDVVSAVKAAGPRVVDASAERTVTGLSWGWLVDAVLSGNEPVTPDELGAILLAARRAGGADPSDVDLFAKDESGTSLDLTAPADQLGLRYANIGAGIGVMRSEIDAVLGSE